MRPETRLKQLLKAVDKEKLEIAKRRDNMREMVEEIEGICSSLDEGIDCVEDGISSLIDGLDSFSQYL